MLLLPLCGACVRNDVVGRSQLIGLSREQELALGAQAQPGLITEMGGKVRDQALQQYVTEVGRVLASHTEGDYPQLPWEFTLLDSDIINAFALPGGKVFISKGLLKEMTNEAQLAGVLGHEVGHVTARHTAERIGQQQWTQIGMQVGSSALGGASVEMQRLGGLALQLGGTLVPLKFSREQELEADALGMRYMVKGGWNPIGTYQVMQILARAGGGGGDALSSLLATHPDPQARADKVQRELQGPYASVVNNPQYQTHEERFNQRAKRRLALLPGASSGFVVAHSSVWCGHCRQIAQFAAASAFDPYGG